MTHNRPLCSIFRTLPALGIVVCGACSLAADKAAPTDTKDHPESARKSVALFKTSVRAVLAERCLGCHGGDSVESGFNLANRAGLLQGGDKGLAVAPGKSRESRLVKLITHREQPAMPHEDDKLSDGEIAAVARWIDLGAYYDKPLVDGPITLTDWTKRTVDESAREFWSFRALSDHQPPDAADRDWCRTPVDRFIRHAQEANGLVPNPPADRRVLIRRAWFALIGLPPTPEAVDRIMADSSPNWFERMVDELLDNRHFGERWARHWLDVARFAESHGFEQDYNREHAYHYRDFVIRAFNDDLPYDRFVRWQLAGDEFAPDNPLAMMATGFLGAGVFPTQLTEREFEPARYDELDDMVSTMGTAMLGMTIGCARCHDHKFDPIPSADYYRLISAFGTTIRSNVEIDTEPEQTRRRLDEWNKKHEPLLAALKAFERDELPRRFEAWRATFTPPKEPAPEWIILDLTEFRSQGGAILTKLDDGSLLASGPNPDFDTYTFVAETGLTDIRAIRLDALAHESFVKGGPGRASNGNMGLGEITVTAAPLSGGDPAKVQLKSPRADFQQNNGNLAIAASIDGKAKTGWAVDPQFGRDHSAIFETPKPFGYKGGTRLTFTLKFDVNNKHNIGRPRLSIATSAGSVPSFDGRLGPQAPVELANLAADRSSLEDRASVLRWYRTTDAQWKRLSDAVHAHEQKRPTPQMATVMVSSEGLKPIPHHADGRGFPHFYKQTHFLRRGDTSQKVRVAEPGYLQVLAREPGHWQEPPPDGSRTSWQRRALANWITDPDAGAGHLLARVIVNRIWHHHFGRGIVATPNDFGKQGTPPSHPELLDWLAQRLIENGWRLKPIHKLILTSAVWQQSSEFDEQRAAADPDNRYLWRRQSRRLEAEIIRDSMLAASGMLDRTPFGPGTLDENHKRRSIYFMIKRSKLIPMMQVFDVPEPLVSVGRRPNTTVASQALTFLNSRNVREYAVAFAERAASDDLAASIENAYRIGLARPPRNEETSAARSFLKLQRQSYTSDGIAPDRADRLALTDLCQTILSLNEFVYVD